MAHDIDELIERQKDREFLEQESIQKLKEDFLNEGDKQKYRDSMKQESLYRGGWQDDNFDNNYDY